MTNAIGIQVSYGFAYGSRLAEASTIMVTIRIRPIPLIAVMNKKLCVSPRISIITLSISLRVPTYVCKLYIDNNTQRVAFISNFRRSFRDIFSSYDNQYPSSQMPESLRRCISRLVGANFRNRVVFKSVNLYDIKIIITQSSPTRELHFSLSLLILFFFFLLLNCFSAQNTHAVNDDVSCMHRIDERIRLMSLTRP